MKLHGAIVTHAESLDLLDSRVVAARWNVLKVVTAWGVAGGWPASSRARVCAMTPYTVVRTHAGDPSAGKAFPHAAEVVKEISPWYTIRPRLFIEIGNEPNISDEHLKNDDYAYGYAWHLERAIAACRRAFPLARIIGPGMSLQINRPERFYELCGAAIRQCDMVAFHVYTESGSLSDSEQMRRAVRIHGEFFPAMPMLLTEYGIRTGSQESRASGYSVLAQSLKAPIVGCLAYHLCDDGAVNPEYVVTTAMAQAYGRLWPPVW